MTAPIHGGFAESEMRQILQGACAAVGLDASGAVLLRGQTNAVVRLAAHSVIAKIARRGTDPQDVHTTVQFVRWLMDLGFPTVPLHRAGDQPVIFDGHAVTFWTYLPQPEDPVPADALAKPLCTLHSLGRPPIELKRLNPIAAIRTSLSRTTVLPTEDLRYLHHRTDHLERALGSLRYDLAPDSILQGDPQHGNALHDVHGAVLCDWDSAAIGQPEWDLVTVEIHCRRFGYGLPHYQKFAEAYGWDVTGWEGFRTLSELRELRMITTNARKAAHEPAKIAEVRHRIDGLRKDDTTRIWNIL
ncbi:phosphotransferase family protein [Streptomyces fildesensis]|uniref:phosphotransferase family protein n=1 Tax=Streptomyces fildesensis TaxID=375757 RepID=UPI0018DF5B51|nr:phosphotransferase [Streptomyces fildesensis]